MAGTSKSAKPRHGSAARFFALVAMFALWVSQPLLDLIGRYPEFLVAHGLNRGGVVALVVVIGLLLPLLVAGLSALITLFNHRFGTGLHLVLMTLLFSLFALMMLNRQEQLQGLLIPAIAAIFGVMASWLYWRSRALELVMVVLAPLAIVFSVLFLLNPGVAILLQPDAAVESSAGQSPGDHAPVIFIILDELPLPLLLDREGQVNAADFPNFAALAKGSNWYRNTTTVSDWTSLAVPAILTGRYPARDLPPSASAYPQSLFSLLGPHYPVHAYESAVRLCPAELCKPLAGVVAAPKSGNWHALAADLHVVYRYLVTPEPWASQLPNIAMRWSGFTDEAYPGEEIERTEIRAGMMFEGRMEVMRKFGESIAAVPGPSFHYLHVLLPHTPYEYLPGGYRYPGGWTVPATDWVSWADHPFYVEQARERFILQLGALDETLGALLRSLRQQGSYDESLLVLTADHGSSFRPGGPWRTVVRDTPSMNDILRVPLFIKLPGQAVGEVNDLPVETVDILPTLAHALGMDIPWPVDGESLLTLAGRSDFPRVFATVENSRFITQLWTPGPMDTAWDNDAGRDEDQAEYRGIVGTSPGDLKPGPMAGTSAVLDRPGSYRNLDLEYPMRPSLVTGVLNSENQPPRRLAIVINGVVERVVEVIEERNVTLFSGLVRPESFIEGDNEVRLFAIDQQVAGGEFALREIPITNLAGNTEYRLVGDNLRVILDGEELTFEAVPDAQLRGVLNTFFSSDQSLEFSGWAVDLDQASAASMLVFFENGRPVHSATMEKPVPGLGATLELEHALTNPGFQVVIPRSRLADPTRPCLRLIAIGHDRTFAELATRKGGWNSGCDPARQR